MRRLATLVVLFLAFGAGTARANAFGQLIPAHPLMGGDNLFGVHLLFGDRVDDIGLLGQVRFSSSPSLDWGLQLGFSDAGDGSVMLGGDIRPIIKRADDEFPLDLAFDGGLGLTIGDDYTIFEIVPAIEASHSFVMDSGGALNPYLGVGLDINMVSIDNNGNGDNDETDLDVVARFGLEWAVSSKFGIQGELGVGDPANDFILGVNVAF